LEDLKQRATVLRRRVIEMVAKLKIGYLQQGLGAADIFTALYFSELRLDETNPDWAERDRCILSTAHNTAIFYATLVERGLLPRAALDESRSTDRPTK
jgi:transketolase